MLEVIWMPGAISSVTSVETGPRTTETILPGGVFRALIFIAVPEQPCLCYSHALFDMRQAHERYLQRNEIPRIGRAYLDAGKQALEIIDFLAAITQIAAQSEILHQLAHSIKPVIDFPDIEQRIFQPFFEQAAAHRRLREIQYIEQRILFAAITQIARDFKIPQRIGVYHEIFRCIQIGQPVQMRKVCFDRFVQIIEQGCNRFLCLRRFRPVVRIEMLDDAVIDSANRHRFRDEYIHWEQFATEVPTDAASFTVVLAQSGLEVVVGADQTILQAIESLAVEVECLCREGVCGTCETRILEGEAEHYDQYLSDEEKAAQQSMMLCVSRAKGQRLVLDL